MVTSLKAPATGLSADPEEPAPRPLVALIPEPPIPEEPIAEIRDPTASLEPPFPTPRSIGGYRVGQRLASIRGGAAYEAWRKSTGRKLSLAIVKPRWATQPTFVSRFTREAFAAGLLDHPNLIPIRVVDVDRGFVFAGSDAMTGEPLSDPRAREGFDRSARVAAILQAARGLRQAHERGVYHRDLSLAKIRVDSSGLVRLADLGVGLTPETPEGPAAPPIAVPGLPPTLAPEPVAPGFVRDDLLGLGRALHSLVGGDRGDRAMPPGLTEVVRRLIGDGHEPGYPGAGAVVRALEAELGIAGTFVPREADVTEFENAAQAFQTAPMANLRPLISAGFAAVIGIFAALTLLAHKPLNTLGVLAFGGIVGAATVAIRGYHRREPVIDRVRELLLGGSRSDLLTVAASLVLLGASLFATGLLGFWIFLTILAVGLAMARYYAIDRPIEQGRVDSIARGVALIRGLRRQAVAEDAIRRFACQQGGAHWEEFFEAIFGYEALRSARKRWGLDAAGRRRPRFVGWRAPIVDAIEARLEARQEARDRSLFEGIEERNLEARGINLLTARRRSRRIAEAIVTFARNYRRTDHDAPEVPLMDALNRVAHRPDDYLTTTEAEEPAGPPIWREILDALIRVLFGARTRFLLGGLFLAGCLLWMHQNALISAEEIQEAGRHVTIDREKAVTDAGEIGRKTLEKMKNVADARTETKSLEVLGLSPGVSQRIDGFGLGVAGLILILSSGFGGVRIAAFAIPGALVAAFGPGLIEAGARPLGPTSLMALAIGAGLFAAGVVFGRSR